MDDKEELQSSLCSSCFQLSRCNYPCIAVSNSIFRIRHWGLSTRVMANTSWKGFLALHLLFWGHTNWRTQESDRSFLTFFTLPKLPNFPSTELVECRRIGGVLNSGMSSLMERFISFSFKTDPFYKDKRKEKL